MKTGRGVGVRGGWGALMLLICALAVASASPAPASASARVQQTDGDCRCVDQNGDAIADCTCFRMPRFEMTMPPMAPSRPRLGISVSTDQGSEMDARGARVTNVLEDGPAWNAGIREGDLITSVDGKSLFQPLGREVEDAFDLDESIPVQRLLAIAKELEPGQEVDVTYLRNGQERRVTVSAEDLSGRSFDVVVPPFDAERFREQMRGFENLRDMGELRQFQWRSGEPGDLDVRVFGGGPGAAFFGGPAMGRYGLELVPLNDGLGQYFGTTEGVLVVNVAEDSALELRAGDVILSIAGRAATTPERVRSILGSYGNDEDISIRVRRNGREIEVRGRLEG